MNPNITDDDIRKQEFTDKFLELELEFDLFDARSCGVPVWERIRFWTYRQLLQKLDITGQAHTRSDQGSLRSNLKGAYLWMKNGFIRNPLFTEEHEYLYFGHKRRKLHEDGYWWDIYCDPIHELGELDYIHIELDHNLHHFRPAKTANLRYADFIEFSGTIAEKLGLVEVELSDETYRILENAQKQFEIEFDTSVSLVEKARSNLRWRASTKPWYARLVSRIKPDLAVVVNSYSIEHIIEACKEASVPVVELQHGIIHWDHLGYSYPGNRTKEIFPDYLLVWGRHWKDAVEYPIPRDRVFAAGFPYLEKQATRVLTTTNEKKILFLSQGTIGKQLSKFALEVESDPRIDHDIVYKLHPGEYDRWEGVYPWLLNANFDVVDSSEPPLYELFAESSVQIGVGSTAVYEGLCFDLETYVYDLPGSSVLEPLVAKGDAKLISSADELASSIGTQEVTFDREFYFEPNPTEKMSQILQRLASKGKIWSPACDD